MPFMSHKYSYPLKFLNTDDFSHLILRTLMAFPIRSEIFPNKLWFCVLNVKDKDDIGHLLEVLEVAKQRNGL